MGTEGESYLAKLSGKRTERIDLNPTDLCVRFLGGNNVISTYDHWRR